MSKTSLLIIITEALCARAAVAAPMNVALNEACRKFPLLKFQDAHATLLTW